MTAREFLKRLSASPHYVRLNEHPTFVEIETEEYREIRRDIVLKPLDAQIDDEVARAICRTLGIPPSAVGL